MARIQVFIPAHNVKHPCSGSVVLAKGQPYGMREVIAVSDTCGMDLVKGQWLIASSAEHLCWMLREVRESE